MGSRAFLILDMSTLSREPAKEEDKVLYRGGPAEACGTHADAIAGETGSNDNTLRIESSRFLVFLLPLFLVRD